MIFGISQGKNSVQPTSLVLPAMVESQGLHLRAAAWQAFSRGDDTGKILKALSWNSPTGNDWNVFLSWKSIFLFLNQLLFLCVFLPYEFLCLAREVLSGEDGASLGKVKQVKPCLLQALNTFSELMERPAKIYWSESPQVNHHGKLSGALESVILPSVPVEYLRFIPE